MSNLKTKFETEFKNKVNQKATGNKTDEIILLKAFRYFDLGNTGVCSLDLFKRVVYNWSIRF